MRNFKELRIWNQGIELTVKSYKLTKQFPPEEKFGLISQINRASSSIPANIAEGCGRSSGKDYARFLEISLGSAFELETHLVVAQKLHLISSAEATEFITMLLEEQKMINGLINKIRSMV